MESSVPDSPSVVPLVHLVPRLIPGAEPPSELLFQRRLGPAGRAIVAGIFVLATMTCGWLAIELWTSHTPGWWFNALFTVMFVGLLIGVWAGFASSVRNGARERATQDQWKRARTTARPVRGNVASRHVGLSEDGGVSSFSLTITTDQPGVAPFEAEWNRPSGSSADLLQSQVPGIGSEARVWVCGQSRSDQQVFAVEVADPTVALYRAH
ncbi:hypothetical protein GCM10027405_37990 [Arthrobacter alkaliphilus]|uniref:hypothetical protein n=1 Tax=Arthrobacter alkaliphilus TaxID=369936 RepID=UPI001F1B9231|nr:hypothetical protein [Arthrobacter alkaliphilus]